MQSSYAIIWQNLVIADLYFSRKSPFCVWLPIWSNAFTRFFRFNY